jgi:hypothetical protein
VLAVWTVTAPGVRIGVVRAYNCGEERIMKRIGFVLLISMVLMACNAFKSMLGPSPSNFESHEHDLVLHVNTVNADSEALGLTRARLPVTRYLFQRPASGPHTEEAFLSWFSETVWIDVLAASESTCVMHAEIRHYTGYQLEFHGDTARFSELDAYPGWELVLLSRDDPLVVDSTDSLVRVGDLPAGLPDTVMGDGPLEIEITFDLDGLFYSGPITGQISLDPTKVEYRQLSN